MNTTESIAQQPAPSEVQMLARIEAMQGFIATLFPEPLPPEDVRAALAKQPQSLHFCADAI